MIDMNMTRGNAFSNAASGQTFAAGDLGGLPSLLRKWIGAECPSDAQLKAIVWAMAMDSGVMSAFQILARRVRAEHNAAMNDAR